MRTRVGRVEQSPQNLAAGGARPGAKRGSFHGTHPFNSGTQAFAPVDGRLDETPDVARLRESVPTGAGGQGPAARRRDQDGATASRQGKESIDHLAPRWSERYGPYTTGAGKAPSVIVAAGAPMHGSTHGSVAAGYVLQALPRLNRRPPQPTAPTVRIAAAVKIISLFMAHLSTCELLDTLWRNCGSSNSTTQPRMCKRNARFFFVILRGFFSPQRRTEVTFEKRMRPLMEAGTPPRRSCTARVLD